MTRVTQSRYVSRHRPLSTCAVFAILLAIALSASADAGSNPSKSDRPTSGKGVPAWVRRECRPATPAELAAQWAGPGEWFYRTTWDFCYLDTRPGLWCPSYC
jgi:hypothetical protein